MHRSRNEEGFVWPKAELVWGTLSKKTDYVTCANVAKPYIPVKTLMVLFQGLGRTLCKPGASLTSC